MTSLINEILENLLNAWLNYLNSMEEVIKRLNDEIIELTTMGNCDAHWCKKTEEIISELDRSLHAIGNSHWADDDNLAYVSKLKQLLSDLHSSFYTASRIS